MSAIILAAYGWREYIAESSTLPPIGLITLILAGATLATSIIMYFVKTKNPLSGSLLVYAMLFIYVVWLVVTTGGVSSPFIALWILVAAFAAIFSWIAVSAVTTIVVIYTVLSVVGDGQLTAGDNLPALLLGGLLPIGLGALIWNKQPHIRRGLVASNEPDTSALHRLANQSEIVINAIGDGVLAIDSRGTIRLINPAAEKLIGWSGRDAVSLDYKSVLQLGTVDSQELPPSLDPISQGLNTNQQYRTNDLSLLTNSGKRLLVSIVVSPIGDPGSGVIVTFRDVTKEKLEERQQAEFISTASHEMRTPVASIEGYLGLALNPATAQIDAKARSYIEKAHESTQHLGRLFQDLLDITKAEDGRLASDPEIIDVVDFTRDIAAGLKPQAEQKSLKIIFSPDTKDIGEKQLHPVYYISQDKDHFREVISNLIENAIKYTKQGVIEIDVAGDEDAVIISIQDSGIGIPPEDISHLFQKFYRVDNTDTREIGGTGLGLYLCRRLVESMNGRIWVESTYKQGSTFFVSIPRLNHAEASDLLERAAESDRQQAKQTPQTPATTPAAPQAAPVPTSTTATPQITQPAAPQITQHPIASAPQSTPQQTYQSQPPQISQTQTPTLSDIEQNPRLYQTQNSARHPRQLNQPETRSNIQTRNQP